MGISKIYNSKNQKPHVRNLLIIYFKFINIIKSNLPKRKGGTLWTFTLNSDRPKLSLIKLYLILIFSYFLPMGVLNSFDKNRNLHASELFINLFLITFYVFSILYQWGFWNAFSKIVIPMLANCFLLYF